MTYAEVKNLLLKLIDESKPKSDITEKLPTFFDSAQKKLAMYYPIYRTKNYTQDDVKIVPEDFGRAFRVFDENEQAKRFKIKDKIIMCSADNFELVYEAVPQDLPLNVADDYLMETQAEAKLALVFYVAAMLNQTEYDQRFFSSYYAQYQGELQNLNATARQPLAVPINGGGVECLFL